MVGLIIVYSLAVPGSLIACNLFKLRTHNVLLIIEIDCYNKDRTKNNERPITFRLIGAAIITNAKLEAQFTAARHRLRAMGRDEKQLFVHHAFHGTSTTVQPFSVIHTRSYV